MTIGSAPFSLSRGRLLSPPIFLLVPLKQDRPNNNHRNACNHAPFAGHDQLQTARRIRGIWWWRRGNKEYREHEAQNNQDDSDGFHLFANV